MGRTSKLARKPGSLVVVFAVLVGALANCSTGNTRQGGGEAEAEPIAVGGTPCETICRAYRDCEAPADRVDTCLQNCPLNAVYSEAVWEATAICAATVNCEALFITNGVLEGCIRRHWPSGAASANASQCDAFVAAIETCPNARPPDTARSVCRNELAPGVTSSMMTAIVQCSETTCYMQDCISAAIRERSEQVLFFFFPNAMGAALWEYVSPWPPA
jgi:hypothetical protein